jgi:hypothetical protein
VKYFIPDSEPGDKSKLGSTEAEGISVNAKDNIYGVGDIRPNLSADKKYVK